MRYTARVAGKYAGDFDSVEDALTALGGKVREPGTAGWGLRVWHGSVKRSGPGPGPGYYSLSIYEVDINTGETGEGIPERLMREIFDRERAAREQQLDQWKQTIRKRVLLEFTGQLDLHTMIDDEGLRINGEPVYSLILSQVPLESVDYLDVLSLGRARVTIEFLSDEGDDD